jgi:hypothetical protein
LFNVRDRARVSRQQAVIRALRNLRKKAMTSEPAATRPDEEGSGTVTKVGENTGLADPGEFCPKVLGPVPLT